jgi:ribA/ribD-fused uncharacterized protein
LETIREFKDEYRWLSNFWFSPIWYEGLNYPTVEHAYQAAKSTSPEVREQFSKLSTPSQAKRRGKLVDLRPDWEQVKRDVMRDLLYLKFKSHILLQQKLLETGDALLEEGNTWHDVYWGISPPGSGKGENWLGKLLMQVREQLRNEPQPEIEELIKND